MALYVVQVPDPPAGFDWQTMVPGQYFWDVTGVTGQLNTLAPTPATVAVDSSGNGHNGTFQPSIAGNWYVPGLVVGNDASDFSIGTLGTRLDIYTPYSAVSWGADFTVEMLIKMPVAGPRGGTVFCSANPGFTSLVQFTCNGGAFPFLKIDNGGAFSWQGTNGVPPNDGLVHHLAVTKTGPTIRFYVDGVIDPLTIVSGPPPVVAQTQTTIGGQQPFNRDTRAILDEHATYKHALSAARIAAHVAAIPAGFAAYSAAVLVDNPDVYYHLATSLISTGRQPTLVVSDGTHETLAIPSGFPATALPGPYRYTWQPALNADTQSTDGTITTVAIPQLRIPAGYTVGTRTLDIQPGDQWSNVALWWDDAYMQSLPEFNPYVYPPGANLRFASSGAGP